jgi:hypothetical protein
MVQPLLVPVAPIRLASGLGCDETQPTFEIVSPKRLPSWPVGLRVAPS